MPDRALVDLARRMIATPSVTGDGTAPLARLLVEAVLSETDLEWTLEAGDGPAQVNLVATKDVGPAPILLNSHLDTVPPGEPALWTRSAGDPFAATEIDGHLYGLGAADAKLDWLCKALALRRFRGRRLRRGVIFAGTFGEESGLRGARALLPRLPQHPVAAWVGEPTELSVVTRHKGLLVVRISAEDPGPPLPPVATNRLEVIGRAAHSSTPDLGENAILAALDLAHRQRLRIVALRGGDAPNKVPAACELEVVAGSAVPAASEPSPGRRSVSPLSDAAIGFLFALRAEQPSIAALARGYDPSFSPPKPTSNLGLLRAEDRRVEATLDFRCLPGDDSRAIVAALEAFAGAERRRRGLDVSVSIERDNPSLHTPADASVVSWSLRVLEAIELPIVLAAKSGCTEAGVYAAAGIPSVVIGPGRSAGNIHAPNERVPIADLERAIEFYSRLVTELCV